MSFVSGSFFILFTVVFLARLVIGRKKTEQSYLIFLLFASIVFYIWHVPAYILIILASAVIDFIAAFWIRKIRRRKSPRRKFILYVSVAANLCLLGFFKYSNFFLDEVHAVLTAIHVQVDPRHLDLILPIGISFYTFQSMSYTLDVYRGVLKPIRSFWKYFLFVSFFPQLVAGPIIRAKEFIYQIDRQRSVNRRVFYRGMYLLILGFFLKMAVADNLGSIVNQYWDAAAAPDAASLLAWLVTLLFSFQIFADFAGYSTIACGLAYLLGFRLPVNFNNPYIAFSFSEFWRRWHITLSMWLKDYLYIPLGGNRRGLKRAFLNLMIVMLIGGLWHGAAWTFVIWGGLHGLALAVERLCGFQETASRRGRVLKTGWFCAVQLWILLAWIFFRSADTGQALAIARNALDFNLRPLDVFPWARCLVFIAPVLAMHVEGFMRERLNMSPLSARARPVLAALMLYATITCFGVQNEFIYFQF